jgi:N-terminal 7TM region of histidine kinase
MNIALLIAFAGALFSFALAFAVLRNEKRLNAQIFFAAGTTLFGVESLFNALAADAATIEDLYHWQRWRLAGISLLPVIWLLFSLSYGRGDRREFLRRWKIIIIGLAVIPPALAGFFFNQLFLPVDVKTDGPHILQLGNAGVALNIIFLLGIVLVLMNLERTFRAAVGTMRWRIKFMLLGLAVLFVERAYTSTEMLLYRGTNLSLQTLDSSALLAASFLVLLSLRREGHFEIDVYPSHSILQNSLTVFLAGIYLVVIGLFAKVFIWLRPAARDGEFPLTAFLVLAALVALTVLLLSERLKLHVSRFVSRHFQRPIFDYRTVWRKFTEATANCTNQTELSQAAVKSATDLFQTLSVTIWLVDDKQENFLFAASNFLSESAAGEIISEKKTTRPRHRPAPQKPRTDRHRRHQNRLGRTPPPMPPAKISSRRPPRCRAHDRRRGNSRRNDAGRPRRRRAVYLAGF